MIDHDCERLRSMGLTAPLISQANELTARLMQQTGDGHANANASRLMRVTEIHRGSICIDDGETTSRATLTPLLARRLAETQAMLTVGDWVMAAADAEGQYLLHHRLNPVNQLVRRDAHGLRYALVSNVDCVLLAMGLDRDFSPRRIERFIALVHGCGASPVIVLTKADTVADSRSLYSFQRTIRERVGTTLPILCVDARDVDTANRLQAYTRAGQTLVVLGSSGAGKSTLTNTLVGAAVQDTGEVREHDSRGKHTTRSRSLFRLPGGACIIDTPGVRALRPDADEHAVAASFSEIQQLAAGCRFRDCRHQDEPGCRVRAEVDDDRLRNYQKLLREARRDETGFLERRAQLGVWKARSRAQRRLQKERE